MLRLAPVFLLTALATEEVHREVCGEGVGDLRSDAAASEACRACRGRMTYHNAQANGLGYTSCPQGDDLEIGPCGVGVGDLRQHPRAAAACQACGGRPHFDVPGRSGSLGYTTCAGGEATAQQPRGAPVMGSSCGTGAGDLTADQGAIDACAACRGVLHFHSRRGPGFPGFTGCHWAPDVGEAGSAEEASWVTEPLFLALLVLSVLAGALLCGFALRFRSYARSSTKLLDEVVAPQQPTTLGASEPPAGEASQKDVHVEMV